MEHILSHYLFFFFDVDLIFNFDSHKILACIWEKHHSGTSMSLLEHYSLGYKVGGVPYDNICEKRIEVTCLMSTEIQQWEGLTGFSGEKYHNFLYDFVRLNDPFIIPFKVSMPLVCTL